MERNAAVPTAAELRTQARDALRGNWKTALGIAAVACLIVSLISLILNIANDLFVINEFRNNPSLAYGEIPKSYLLEIITILVNTLISPLYTLPIVRIAVAAVNGKKISFEMLRVSWKEIFKAVRLELVMAWRTMMIPMLIYIAVAFSVGLILHMLGASLELVQILFGLSSIALIVVFVMRMMYYSLMYPLMVICPDDSARVIADRSRKVMKGNRKRLFWMDMSFIGWMLPFAVLTVLAQRMLAEAYIACSIFVFVYSFLILPLALYMQTALAAFTKDLLERG